MKTTVASFLFMILSLLAVAQQDTLLIEEPEQERRGFFNHPNIYYGGFLDVTLGTYTAIGATPMIAYKFTNRYSAGMQLSYRYMRDKSFDPYFKTTSYGFSIFSRLRIIPELYVHTEYSQMNFDDSYGGSTRGWVPFLLVGGGYSQPVSENVWFNIQLLYDVLRDSRSPYSDWEPFYSVGFGVGF